MLAWKSVEGRIQYEYLLGRAWCQRVVFFPRWGVRHFTRALVIADSVELHEKISPQRSMGG